jgi:hypothetical protein
MRMPKRKDKKMTRKDQLKNIVETYRADRLAHKSALEQIKKNPLFSDEGKRVEIEALKAVWEKARSKYQGDINKFFESWKIERKPNDDVAYQLKLNNLLQSFQLIGNSLSVDEVKQYAIPFADDELAIKTLSAALKDPVKSVAVETLDTTGKEQETRKELHEYYAVTMLDTEQLDIVVNFLMLGQINYDQRYDNNLSVIA